MTPSLIDRALRRSEFRQLDHFASRVAEIESAGEEFSDLPAADLRVTADHLRERARNGEDLDLLLPEAFALVSRAAETALGLRLYSEQLIGGQVMAAGAIAEMKTGEGKTLTATLPAFLYSLLGQGVHLVTANEYLAARDAEWMGPVYDLLGLSVAALSNEDSLETKQRKYRTDVLYATASALGFDYLRDNMTLELADCVQQGHGFILVDEIDKVLIDEAGTPLLISGPAVHDPETYLRFDQLAREMVGVESKVRLRSEGESADTSGADYDFEYEPKQGTVAPTERGVKKAEEFLGIDNLYLADSGVTVNHFHQALKAHSLFQRDRDYAVVDGEIKIIDPGTGRIMSTRRWAEGLHQAVEAKEGIEVTAESQILASITVQNYFRLYRSKAGMTGTALSEASEFMNTYGLAVYEIPPHRPMIREDDDDWVFRTLRGKWQAIIDEIARRNKTGQPILVGTTSIKVSQALSKRLRDLGIDHQVLNAKPEHASREAEIVAQAGRLGAVTIATNMAGRGVDIKLGGDPEMAARAALKKRGILPKDSGFAQALIRELPAQEEVSRREADEVRETGGLYVLGSERHQSRRIDNQLRGRAGRQGDPGKSRFFVSAEDEMIRLYSGDRLFKALARTKAPEDQPVSGRIITKAIANAQEKIESNNELARKRLLDYDDVLAQQRQVIYRRRHEVLEGQDIEDLSRREITEVFDRLFELYMPEADYPDTWDLGAVERHGREILPEFPDLSGFVVDQRSEALELVQDRVVEVYDRMEDEFGSKAMRSIERQLYLRVFDHHWREHLYEMDYVRKGIHLRALAGNNPLIAYKNEGLEMFGEMINWAWSDYARLLFHTKPKSD